jgi:hypothetical protein
MPGKETARSDDPRRRRLRQLTLAAILVALTVLLGSGAAMADGWPSGKPDSGHSHSHAHT